MYLKNSFLLLLHRYTSKTEKCNLFTLEAANDSLTKFLKPLKSYHLEN